MIYTYRHLAHRIEGFHAYIVHFFEEMFKNDLAAYNENVLLQASFIPIVNSSKIFIKL